MSETREDLRVGGHSAGNLQNLLAEQHGPTELPVMTQMFYKAQSSDAAELWNQVLKILFHCKEFKFK